MSPTIVAAIIAAGSTGIVAIAGFFFNWSSTKRTVAAGTGNTARVLETARSDRVWDKRATAYVDAITAVQWQQARRRRTLFAAGNSGRLLPEEKSPVDWGNLQGQLFAFAAPAVLIALKDANDAGLRASGFCLELADVICKPSNPGTKTATTRRGTSQRSTPHLKSATCKKPPGRRSRSPTTRTTRSSRRSGLICTVSTAK
jgi:hypothetical protein